MKSNSILFAFALSLVPTMAFATQSKHFASCSGDHHGAYLNLTSIVGSVTSDIVQVNVGVTNDSGGEPEFYEVKKVTKDGMPIVVKAYSWAIRQAIKASAADVYYGFVKVTAVNAKTGKTLYMNINKFTGVDALAIDGNIELMTCNSLVL